MGDSRRPFRYIWVTWLKGYLSGEDRCRWRLWRNANFKLKSRDDGFDLDGWRLRHDQAVTARMAQLRKGGFAVQVEGQNKFEVEGKAANVAGQCDIVAFKDGVAIVEDIKTGRARASDVAQVRLYMFLLPKFDQKYSGDLAGYVLYPETGVYVEVPAPDDAFKVAAVELIQSTAKSEPSREPSERECRFCTILQCPDRQDTSGSKAAVKTEDF